MLQDCSFHRWPGEFSGLELILGFIFRGELRSTQCNKWPYTSPHQSLGWERAGGEKKEGLMPRYLKSSSRMCGISQNK